jgi:hypothetical protein
MHASLTHIFVCFKVLVVCWETTGSSCSGLNVKQRLDNSSKPIENSSQCRAAPEGFDDDEKQLFLTNAQSATKKKQDAW